MGGQCLCLIPQPIQNQILNQTSSALAKAPGTTSPCPAGASAATKGSKWSESYSQTLESQQPHTDATTESPRCPEETPIPQDGDPKKEPAGWPKTSNYNTWICRECSLRWDSSWLKEMNISEQILNLSCQHSQKEVKGNFLGGFVRKESKVTGHSQSKPDLHCWLSFLTYLHSTAGFIFVTVNILHVFLFYHCLLLKKYSLWCCKVYVFVILH